MGVSQGSGSLPSCFGAVDSAVGVTVHSGHIARSPSPRGSTGLPAVHHSAIVDVLVAYDIADTEGPGAQRLRNVADVCAKYGERVQLSVFECRVSPERFSRLVGELQDLINPQRDSVVIYRFAGEDPNGSNYARPAAVARTGRALGLVALRNSSDPWKSNTLRRNPVTSPCVLCAHSCCQSGAMPQE